jgi:hypothetical protein
LWPHLEKVRPWARDQKKVAYRILYNTTGLKAMKESGSKLRTPILDSTIGHLT